MTMVDTIKNNPWKVLFGSASSIIAIVGALFTLDARYAHAADVEKDKARTEKIIIETTANLRRQMLEDKLWELDIKKEQSPTGRLSPYEAALRERYVRQINELNQSRIVIPNIKKEE